MITVKELTKRYGAHTAVDALSFTVDKGQIYGLLGPNGAGKSTTMNIITGYISATDGTAEIDGCDIFDSPAEARAKIGYLPEQPPLYTDMTPREYLAFAAELKGLPREQRKAAVEQCMERTNIRYVTPDMLEETPSLCVIDVSFISLKLVLPVVSSLLTEDGHVANLIKPQFEAGKGKVGKKGVVREPEIHLEVLQNYVENAHAAGFKVLDVTFSPIKGPEGNIEFLGYLAKQGEEHIPDLAEVVRQAHEELDAKA